MSEKQYPENITPILMPQAGQSMEEGTILTWLVKEGETIEQGQAIFEIETDKATMEVEATDSGRVAKIIANEGDIVEVKQPVAFLADEGVDLSPVLGGETPAEKTTEKPAQNTENVDITPILMPQAGQSMEEGTILTWLIKEGETIEEGQAIFEIETDKATMEVEATDSGRVAKIVANEGDIIEVKQPVAYLADEGVDIDAVLGTGSTEKAKETAPAQAKPVETATKSEVSTSKPATTSGDRIKASPAARRIAKEKGLDLADITTASGPHGRIISKDVENAQPSTAKSAPQTTKAVQPAAYEGTRSLPVSKMRKMIAKNLTYSKQNVPHFYMKATIKAGKLFDVYKKTKEIFKCSVNDFVIAACAKTIMEFPAFRSHYKETEILEFGSANIGIAVGTDNGLTVPVIVGADKLTFKGLSERSRAVVESARNGKIEGMGEGVFTITNLGMFGTEEFSGIINPPESGILAVGAILEDVIAENGAIKATKTMKVQLSADHRIVDGLLAAQFVKRLKEILEDPEQLL